MKTVDRNSQSRLQGKEGVELDPEVGGALNSSSAWDKPDKNNKNKAKVKVK